MRGGGGKKPEGKRTGVVPFVGEGGKVRRAVVVNLGRGLTRAKLSGGGMGEREVEEFVGRVGRLGGVVGEVCRGEEGGKEVGEVWVVVPPYTDDHDDDHDQARQDDEETVEMMRNLGNRVLENVAFNVDTGMYKDSRYKGTSDSSSSSSSMSPGLKTVTISCGLHATTSHDDDPSGAESVRVGRCLARGTNLARDMVNSPPNVLNPLSMSSLALSLSASSASGGGVSSRNSGSLTCRVMDESECSSLGMGAFLGVGRGSETPPRLIHLTYKSGSPTTVTALVGKGLTFDSGGYNIKTSMMELMKFDMGGAAAVFGAARSIADIGIQDVEVHFIVACCENMISSRSMRPSDVLVASDGTTIEVVNTDAEGRLTLADALVYARGGRLGRGRSWSAAR